jgi:hypothetical protein
MKRLHTCLTSMSTLPSHASKLLGMVYLTRPDGARIPSGIGKVIVEQFAIHLLVQQWHVLNVVQSNVRGGRGPTFLERHWQCVQRFKFSGKASLICERTSSTLCTAAPLHSPVVLLVGCSCCLRKLHLSAGTCSIPSRLLTVHLYNCVGRGLCRE